MSFDIDVRKVLGPALITARFAASDGITLLWGPSGVGKTSILNMIAGLLRPDQGHISVDGEILFDADAAIDLPSYCRRIGYVFQDGRLFPHLRVRANLLYGYRLATPQDRWMSLQAVVDFLGLNICSAAGHARCRAAKHNALPLAALCCLAPEPCSWTSLSPPLTLPAGKTSWMLSCAYGTSFGSR